MAGHFSNPYLGRAALLLKTFTRRLTKAGMQGGALALYLRAIAQVATEFTDLYVKELNK